jgi:hypothetical protein
MTILIERSTQLASKPSGRFTGHSALFVCRIETNSRSEAHTRGLAQVLNHDLEIWNSDEKNLFKMKPSRDHYSVVSSYHGYPAIIRPE